MYKIFASVMELTIVGSFSCNCQASVHEAPFGYPV